MSFRRFIGFWLLLYFIGMSLEEEQFLRGLLITNTYFLLEIVVFITKKKLLIKSNYKAVRRMSMLTTFKVILIIVLLVTALGTIGASSNNERTHYCSLAIACIAALTFLFKTM